MTYFRQVSQARFGEKEIQHRVITRLLLQTRNSAVRIVKISEYDRTRRTRLRTSRRERSFRHYHIPRCSRFHLLRNLRLFNALDAECAFLHDAAHPNRDVWILDHLEQIPLVILALVERPHVKAVADAKAALVVIEIIELPDLIRTVVRTVTSAN